MHFAWLLVFLVASSVAHAMHCGPHLVWGASRDRPLIATVLPSDHRPFTLVAQGKEVFVYEDLEMRSGWASVPSVTAVPLEIANYLDYPLRALSIVSSKHEAFSDGNFILFAGIDIKGEIFLFIPRQSKTGKVFSEFIASDGNHPYLIYSLGKAGNPIDGYTNTIGVSFYPTASGLSLNVVTSSNFRTYRTVIPLGSNLPRWVANDPKSKFSLVAEVGGAYLSVLERNRFVLADEQGQVTLVSGRQIKSLPRIPVLYLSAFAAYESLDQILEMIALGPEARTPGEVAPMRQHVFRYLPAEHTFIKTRSQLPLNFHAQAVALGAGNDRSKGLTPHPVLREHSYVHYRSSKNGAWDERALFIGELVEGRAPARIEVMGMVGGVGWVGNRTLVYPEHDRRPTYVPRLIELGIPTHEIGILTRDSRLVEDSIKQRLLQFPSVLPHQVPHLLDSWLERLAHNKMINDERTGVRTLLKSFGARDRDSQILLLDILSQETMNELNDVTDWRLLTWEAYEEIESIAVFLFCLPREVIYVDGRTTIQHDQSNAQKYLYFYARSKLGRSETKFMSELQVHLSEHPNLRDVPLYRLLASYLAGPEGDPLWNVMSSEALRSFLPNGFTSVEREPSGLRSTRP